jgi:hypothetical protein
LDIRVSDIIKAQDVTYNYNIKTTNISDIFYYNINNDVTKNNKEKGTLSNSNNYEYNVIKIPLVDSTGAEMKVDALANKSIRIVLNSIDESDPNVYKDVYEADIYASNVYNTENNIFINFSGKEELPKSIKLGTNSKLKIIVSYGNDFYSTSNYSTYNYYQYGLSLNKAKEAQRFIQDWVNNATQVNEANRAIPLPYFVQALGTNTRSETIMRKGILQNTYETQLTEKAFWMYLVPKIIENYYDNVDLSEEDVNGDRWSQIDTLVRDLYTQFKATFCDSILDDNNNIVNFSMDNEIPVVRLKITYKYGV